MSPAKVYVNVLAKFDRDGNITPLIVEWEDGRQYEIDNILDVRRNTLQCGNEKWVRYMVLIGKNRTVLYYEDPAWFVERKIHS